MAHLIDTVTTLAEPVLEPGEHVVAATRVNPKGTAKTAGFQALGGLVGILLARKAVRKGQEQAVAAGFPVGPYRQMALALTERRVLVYGCSPWTAKPKEMLGDVERSAIRTASISKNKLTDALVLSMADGSEVEFEAMKVDKPATLVDALVGDHQAA